MGDVRLTYHTPGVYIEELYNSPPVIVQAPSAVPVFVGHTQTGQQFTPVKVNSFSDFIVHFGEGPDKDSFSIFKSNGEGPLFSLKYCMYYSIKAFFSEGGKSCYIISVGDYTQEITKEVLSQGIAVLENTEDPTLVLVPDANALPLEDCAILYQLVFAHCADSKNRFAILDVKQTLDAEADCEKFINLIGNRNLMHGAAYYPFLVAESTLPKKEKILIPPSGFIAGTYATTDETGGVWKPPSFVMAAMATGAAVSINDKFNETITNNSSGISLNAIRKAVSRTGYIAGIRTLAGDNNEWRYIGVRRLANMIRQSIGNAFLKLMFEPNDQATWNRAKAMTEDFLLNLWNKGALAGRKAEDAFFVQAGLGKSMTARDISEGKMIIIIGIAPFRRAEFIILRIVQQM